MLTALLRRLLRSQKIVHRMAFVSEAPSSGCKYAWTRTARSVLTMCISDFFAWVCPEALSFCVQARPDVRWGGMCRGTTAARRCRGSARRGSRMCGGAPRAPATTSSLAGRSGRVPRCAALYMADC